MRWFFNNLVFKMFAFVMALILWLYVGGELEDGLRRREEITFSKLPIRILSPSGVKFYVEITPKKADIVLGGYNIKNRGLLREDILLFVDLGELPEGVYQLPLQYKIPKEVAVKRIVPSTIRVAIR